jgi:uncharacterized protein (TIGR00369 family)
MNSSASSLSAPILSAEATLQQWIAQEAQIQATMQAAGSTVGVATPEQMRGKTGLQMMQAMMAGELPRPSISETIDFTLVEVSHGLAIFQGKPHPQCLNPLGTMHGGWYCTLLDSALGCAVHTTMPEGRAYTTLELKVNLVRAVSQKVPLVRAIGKVIHVGNQVATSEASLIGPDGKLYAHATTTCLVFEMR